MTLFRALAAFAFLVSIPALAQNDRLPEEPRVFPILAWGGPPQDQTTVERFKELADCGFTWNYSGYANADAAAKALDVCEATGVRLMVSLPELQRDPEGIADRFKGHRGLGGYYLRDEPAAIFFPELAAWAKRIQSRDADHPCYVNLYPNYAPPDALGTPTYAAYVERFLAEVPVPFISFDHYPVVGQSLRGEWYQNLEIISAAARKGNKPFWAFALAVAHGPYPVPTVAHLRVLAYSNLAYGAQGLQYFTYWTSKSDTWDFHEGPIRADGTRSPVYDRVRDVNREVQAMRAVFLGARVLSVTHTGAAPPAGTRRFAAEAPVESLETAGQGAVVSRLAKADRQFLVVVNRDINSGMRLDLRFKEGTRARLVKRDGSLADEVKEAARIDVAPGDAAVFTWLAG